MDSTIDPAGRVVIPKSIRERLGLHGGAAIEIELVSGHVEIHPKGVDVRVDRLDDGPVLRVPADTPPMTTEDVRRMLDEDRSH